MNVGIECPLLFVDYRNQFFSFSIKIIFLTNFERFVVRLKLRRRNLLIPRQLQSSFLQLIVRILAADFLFFRVNFSEFICMRAILHKHFDSFYFRLQKELTHTHTQKALKRKLIVFCLFVKICLNSDLILALLKYILHLAYK